MFLHLLYLLSLTAPSLSIPKRRDSFHPIRDNCFNIDFCREVASDNLCDLECSSAECGFDGGRACVDTMEMEAKMMLALHISPSDFMFVSHRFLSEISSITGCRVEIARDSQDLLIWEWSPSTGPNQRLYPEKEPSPSGITSIQVMLSFKLFDCSKECMKIMEESIRLWYQSVTNEEVSQFMEEMLYGESHDEKSSNYMLIVVILISGCIVFLLGVLYHMYRRKVGWNEHPTSYDVPQNNSLSLPPRQKRVMVREVNRLDKGQESPLHSLISSCNQLIEEDIEALIKCGEPIDTVDREGRSVLHISIIHGRSPLFVEWLISKGVDPSIVDDKDQTLLHLAVTFNNIKMLATLFKFPTVYRMINNCDYRNMSALKLSMSEESVDISRMLINNGANVNLIGMEGSDPLLCHRSPLHLAVMNNHRQQVELLLERGADVNAVDDRGLTPLHYAVMHCETEMVQFIVSMEKCDVVRRDKQLRTAEDLARTKGKIEIVNLLKEVTDKKSDGTIRPYLKNLRLHKSRELLTREPHNFNMKLGYVAYTIRKSIQRREKQSLESSHHTYVQPNLVRAICVHSNETDEGVYSDYQYPLLTPRFHSTQTLYYL